TLRCLDGPVLIALIPSLVCGLHLVSRNMFGYLGYGSKMLAKSEKNQWLFVFLGSPLNLTGVRGGGGIVTEKTGILVVRYIMKPSLALRSYSKRKISNI
ncbi:hypothetical protein RJ640_010460, partial [Escallonia rubra]